MFLLTASAEAENFFMDRHCFLKDDYGEKKDHCDYAANRKRHEVRL